MKFLVAIDPGNSPGIAVFVDGVLTSCGIDSSHSPYVPDRRAGDFECVCEIPQVYRVGRGKGDPNDLIKVAIIAGRMTAAFQKPEFVSPKKWKAQVDGDIMCQRIEGFLTAAEREVIPNYAASIRHNVIDAIGIGLWRLGRMGRGGAPV